MARHAVEADALWAPRSEAQERLQGLVVRRRQLVDAVDAEVKRHKAARTPPTRDSIDRTLTFLRQEKREVEKSIDAAVTETEEIRGAVKLLEEIRGVGPVTATTLLATVSQQRDAKAPRRSPFRAHVRKIKKTVAQTSRRMGRLHGRTATASLESGVLLSVHRRPPSARCLLRCGRAS